MDTHALFAHVNDSIRGLTPEAAPGEMWEFFCECPDAECHELVNLTLGEFDERRAASPPEPILAIAHEADRAAIELAHAVHHQQTG